MFLDSKGERKVIKNKIIKVQDILITVASEDFDDEMERLVVMNPEDILKYPWTDIGAGMLFADFYKETLRYVPERKSWFFYEGGIWQTWEASRQ
mgnify:CR=1 FL=1